jgi:carbonic anhydrase/acetyltransferase-like protein (isoleucine patch superfamily)
MTIYALGDKTPQIADDTWVAPDANLIGLVVLETAASVWFGSTIRADHEEIRIGAGSNVQENTVMNACGQGLSAHNRQGLHYRA